MNPFQSNWETTYRPTEYWNQSVPWPTVANKMDSVKTFSDQWRSPSSDSWCIIQLQWHPLSESERLWVAPVCHRDPLSIRVWRSRGPLTHGWRDRRRCTRHWSLCRCRTRQSGISRPGRWCCWSGPRTTAPRNTWEKKRIRCCTARITDYLSYMCAGFTITGISRLKRWCLKRNQDTSHMEWRQTCFGRTTWSQWDKTDHSL